MKEGAGSSAYPFEVPPERMASLIQELQIQHIELEMQNDELRRVKGALEKTRDKYSHLYDFSPVGYVTLTEKGIIVESNLPLSSMLGVERTTLIGKPFTRSVLGEDQDVFYKLRHRLLETEESQSCELRLVKKDGHAFFANLECMVVKNRDDDSRFIRGAVSNITERHLIAEALQEANDDLEQRVEERTVELLTAFSEIKKLKNQLEAENIYFRQERKMKQSADLILGRAMVSNMFSFGRSRWLLRTRRSSSLGKPVLERSWSPPPSTT